MSFKQEQYKRVESLLLDSGVFHSDTGNGFYKGKQYPFILTDANKNLFAPIREEAIRYFAENSIGWWGGTLTNHPLSSQVACVNHLFPLRKDKEAVLQLLKQFDPELTEVLPIHTDGYEPAYIQFEAVSDWDYLNEQASTRGSNCTSIDAFIYARRKDGRRVIVPIEWKYVESYSNVDKSSGEKGKVRKERYTELIKSSGQLKDTGNQIYYFEPFYQLMRQTLWAEQMVLHNNMETVKAEDYLHIHVIPKGNYDLLDKTYRCSGGNMEDTWRSCLKNQSRYLLVTPERLFSQINPTAYGELLRYLSKRYWQ